MLSIKNNKSNKVLIFACFFVYAYLLLLFCSGASPLIKQFFGDTGFYIYYGRWMQSGGLPFVNSPDPTCKGIYQWFVNYLGALITPTSVTGNYIIEALFKSIDLCLLYSIFTIFFKDTKKSIIASLLTFTVMVSRPCYVFGNQNEQYQYTGLLITLLILSKYNQKRIVDEIFEFPMKYMLILGICFSFVFGFKMNYTLAFVPVAIVIVGDMFLRKKFMPAIKNIIGGLIGVILGAFPGFFYMLQNGLLKIFYERCFLQMKNGYGETIDIKHILNFIFHLKTIWLFPLIICSLYIIIKNKKIIKPIKCIYVFMFLCSFIACILSGHVFAIYHYQLYPYILPIVYFLVSFAFDRNLKFLRNNVLPVICIFILSIVINMNFILIHIPGFNLGSTFDGMKTMKEFGQIVDNKVSNPNYKIYSVFPHFYVLKNKVGSHLKYVYYPETYEFIDNVEESINNLENDVLLLSEKQIEDYNIEDFLSRNYSLECENLKWGFKCYIKNRS